MPGVFIYGRKHKVDCQIIHQNKKFDEANEAQQFYLRFKQKKVQVVRLYGLQF